MNSAERQALAAAAAIRECRQVLAASGSTILRQTVGSGGIAEWRHYPDGEAYDPGSHAQYFFHRHAGGHSRADELEAEVGEAGHFHLFLRPEGMPRGISPLLLPELAVANAPAAPQAAPLKRSARDEVCHLVAIAVDQAGEPVRLFTTNRWVTGETWYSASDVIRMLDRFQLDRDASCAVLDRWLGAVVQLFRPEIAVLLRQRDEAITGWRRRRRSNAFEDTRLEITSSFDIDLDARLEIAERLAGDAGPSGVPRSPPQLPRMAEGWGV